MGHASRNGERRNRSTSAALVSGVVCFSLVLAVLFYAATRKSASPTPHAGQSAQPSPESSAPASADLATPSSVAANRATADSAAKTPQGGTPHNTAEQSASSDSQAPSAALDSQSPTVAASRHSSANQPAGEPDNPIDHTLAPHERLQAQLDAGEFGPALETVELVANADQRTRFLKMVADAQMDAGEFDAALSTIRRMPNPQQRVEARAERATRESTAGGGVNIDQLVELITNNTGKPDQESWEDGGGIGTIDTWDPSGMADGGIRVDPQGLLYRLTRAEQEGRLEALGVRARQADLNQDMARPSSLRLVSLTRLEREIARRQAEGLPVLTTMKHLAGLSQVRYVFIYRKENELVIGGPAESWQYNDDGIPVGVSSGRPTLQLDDLVTVVRTFSRDGAGIFRCSIEPREEGLKRVQQFVAKSNAGGSIRASSVRSWVRRLEQLLGPQDVQIEGVPPESRVARVIVEADYRMKLIGIDKLDAGVNLPSFFDLLPLNQQQNPAPLDALRWWLTMKYDAVMHSPDADVFEIQGSSVLCRSENELITATGRRVSTGTAEAANRAFARHFTSMYAELAENDSIFADLQNIFDLALVAALIRHERLDERVDWDLGVFASSGAYRPARYEPVKTAMSAANYRMYAGRHIVAQVAGGVRGDLMSVIDGDEIFREATRLSGFAQKGRPPELPQANWWWDAVD